MANTDEREEDTQPRNEWEVVSLTASAYNASLSPHNVDLKNDWKHDTYDETNTSRALFMSDHFIFPPREHEDLPVEAFLAESRKDNKDSALKGEDLSNEFPRKQFHVKTVNTEQSTYGESTLSSFLSETVGGGSTKSPDVEPNEYPERGLAFASNASNPIRPAKDAKHSVYNLPCEAWWRRRAASVYAHGKETNALWSLFITAAPTGLIVLGQLWQQERSNFR